MRNRPWPSLKYCAGIGPEGLKITAENLSQSPGVGCLRNANHRRQRLVFRYDVTRHLTSQLFSVCVILEHLAHKEAELTLS